LAEFREFQDGEIVAGTRYRVLRLAGSGGMGRVYEVEHVELGKRFVLKALLRELARREDLVQRLRNEWRALARLEHPHIVSVTDAGTSDNGVPYYVMERLEGETLAARLRRVGRLLMPQALHVGAAILDGLHAAHEINVIHRDVKPANVFLVGESGVKLLDFGIAKVQDAGGVVTQHGTAVGTPRYMSPEQARGAGVEACSDIYAAGLILFEMVSGAGPYDDVVDHGDLLRAQIGREAPRLSSVWIVPPELDLLLSRMLAKDPRERPRSAKLVADVLRKLKARFERSVSSEAPTVIVQVPHVPLPSSKTARITAPAPAPSAATLTVSTSAISTDAISPSAISSNTVTTNAISTSADSTSADSTSAGASASTHRWPEPVPAARLGEMQTGIAPRLPDATLYGVDTQVDPFTLETSVVPLSQFEHTEVLAPNAVPLWPGTVPLSAQGTEPLEALADQPTRTLAPPAPPAPSSAAAPNPKNGRDLHQAWRRALPFAAGTVALVLALLASVAMRALITPGSDVVEASSAAHLLSPAARPGAEEPNIVVPRIDAPTAGVAPSASAASAVSDSAAANPAAHVPDSLNPPPALLRTASALPPPAAARPALVPPAPGRVTSAPAREFSPAAPARVAPAAGPGSAAPAPKADKTPAPSVFLRDMPASGL
jgi:serine/threonine-protein kinase